MKNLKKFIHENINCIKILRKKRKELQHNFEAAKKELKFYDKYLLEVIIHEH